MIPALLLVALFVVPALAVGAFSRFWSSRLLRSRLRHRAIVTLKDGTAFSGVLFESDREVFVLRNAELLEAGPKREPVPVDGEVLILRADLLYLNLA